MKALDVEDCTRWLVGRGGRLGLQDAPLLSPSAHRIEFLVPKESATQVVLANWLAHWCRPSGALVWMTVWGEELPGQMDVFIKVRSAGRVEKPLRAAPGCLLENDDGHVLEQLLLLLMAFNWEAMVYESSPPNAIWIADEVIEVAVDDAQRADSLVGLLQKLSIAPSRS